jgi:hypothetical protein
MPDIVQTPIFKDTAVKVPDYDFGKVIKEHSESMMNKRLYTEGVLDQREKDFIKSLSVDMINSVSDRNVSEQARRIKEFDDRWSKAYKQNAYRLPTDQKIQMEREKRDLLSWQNRVLGYEKDYADAMAMIVAKPTDYYTDAFRKAKDEYSRTGTPPDYGFLIKKGEDITKAGSDWLNNALKSDYQEKTVKVNIGGGKDENRTIRVPTQDPSAAWDEMYDNDEELKHSASLDVLFSERGQQLLKQYGGDVDKATRELGREKWLRGAEGGRYSTKEVYRPKPKGSGSSGGINYDISTWTPNDLTITVNTPDGKTENISASTYQFPQKEVAFPEGQNAFGIDAVGKLDPVSFKRMKVIGQTYLPVWTGSNKGVNKWQGASFVDVKSNFPLTEEQMSKLSDKEKSKNVVYKLYFTGDQRWKDDGTLVSGYSAIPVTDANLDVFRKELDAKYKNIESIKRQMSYADYQNMMSGGGQAEQQPAEQGGTAYDYTLSELRGYYNSDKSKGKGTFDEYIKALEETNVKIDKTK